MVPGADCWPPYLPGLAGALTNLGTGYIGVGAHVEVITAVEKAGTLYRALATEDPAYLPELVIALSDLGSWYGEVGAHEDVGLVMFLPIAWLHSVARR